MYTVLHAQCYTCCVEKRNYRTAMKEKRQNFN